MGDIGISAYRQPTPAQVRAVNAQARRLAKAYKRFRPLVPRQRSPAELGRSLALPADRAAAPAVTSYDWRSHITIRPPSLQGDCNSCTSFAVAAAIEANWLIANTGNPISVSAGYIHTCLGHPGETDAALICTAPVDLAAAVAAVQSTGYALSTPGDYPLGPGVCASIPVARQISGSTPIAGPNDAKARIVNGPIVADLYIWQDFLSYTTVRSPAYQADTSQPGPFLHSVCVVGFDGSGWIIMNSYGPDWGDGRGFATIPYNAAYGMLGAPPPPGGYPREAFAIQV